MIKHILTTKCPRTCKYCISKNIHIEEYDGPAFIDKLAAVYFNYFKLHKQIMFTGGEPTHSKHLYDAWNLAQIIFDEIFITSANPAILSEPKSAFRFNAITYSLHTLDNIPPVENGAIVYASIMSDKLELASISKLKKLGYSGLTINENHFADDKDSNPFLEAFLYSIDAFSITTANSRDNVIYDFHGFSIKINRRGQCFRNNTVYIMPDLTTRNSFEEFLK
jgi:hypothetical protein